MKKFVASIGCLLALVACGGGDGGDGGDGTRFWVDHHNSGLDLYLSTTVSGDEIAGYAEYTNRTFQHYDGTKSADGTFQVSVFTGSTATLDGKKLTLVDREGHSYSFTETDESDYLAAGGPGKDGTSHIQSQASIGDPAESPSSQRPSVEQIAAALTDPANPLASALGDDQGLRADAVGCIAQVLYGSDISDEGLTAVVEGDESFSVSPEDSAAIDAISGDMTKCITG